MTVSADYLLIVIDSLLHNVEFFFVQFEFGKGCINDDSGVSV